MQYLLITPLKDEEGYLNSLRHSVINQTFKPRLFVIVDSGSRDRTYETARTIFSSYDWVHVIKQQTFYEKSYGHKNFAQAINEGYHYAKQVTESQKIAFDFIGKTDATPILAHDYFEKLLSEMEIDNKLAFTCGKQVIQYGKKEIEIKERLGLQDTAINDIRLYRRDFFEQTGGYPLCFSPDTVLFVKAITHGWNIKKIDTTYFLKPRPDGTKIGFWKGNMLKGYGRYCLGYHPLTFLVSIIDNSISMPPHYQGFPLLMGYLSGILKCKRRNSDPDVRDYFGTRRLAVGFRTKMKYFQEKLDKEAI